VTTPPAKRRDSPVTGYLLFLGLVFCSQAASPFGAVRSSPPIAMATASTTVTVPAAASPADREDAVAVLATNITHYRNVFAQGQAIIDHTQYASAAEVRMAMADPSSAAARFQDYRHNSNPELDRSFLDAFWQADRHFTMDKNHEQSVTGWTT
jgi:hypothetical protein